MLGLLLRNFKITFNVKELFLVNFEILTSRYRKNLKQLLCIKNMLTVNSLIY